MASEASKLLRYSFVTGNSAHFRSNRWEMTDLSLSCCIQNKLKHNFFGRVSLLQVGIVTGISTKWFENFPAKDRVIGGGG